MNRIEKKFSELKQKNKKALITFITAGDPDLAGTKRLVLEMEKEGADIIELGIPYSDPIAEGPVIQQANSRALKNSITIKDIMHTVKELRKETQIPILFLLYYNCVFKAGIEKFLERCVECGVDGLIIPDLPYEEREDFDRIAANYPVDVISLIAPTSSERIEKIARSAKGFIYCVSSLGVTGIRDKFETNFESFFNEIKKHAVIPTAIGFGISSPEHVRKLKGYSEGLIVGSAIVKRIGESMNADEAVAVVGSFVKELRGELDNNTF